MFPRPSQRTVDLLWCFVTGIVGDLPRQVVQRRNENWARVSNKAVFLAKVEQRSQNRRKSMAETAERSSYLGVIIAFVVAAGAQLLGASGTDGTSEFFLKIGVAANLLAGCIICLAIAAKAKVWKKPRPGGFSEPDEMLAREVDAHDPDELERDEVFSRLHKRKLVLVVERRAQHAAAVTSVLGSLVMIIGVLIR